MHRNCADSNKIITSFMTRLVWKIKRISEGPRQIPCPHYKGSLLCKTKRSSDGLRWGRSNHLQGPLLAWTRQAHSNRIIPTTWGNRQAFVRTWITESMAARSTVMFRLGGFEIPLALVTRFDLRVWDPVWRSCRVYQVLKWVFEGSRQIGERRLNGFRQFSAGDDIGRVADGNVFCRFDWHHRAGL